MAALWFGLNTPLDGRQRPDEVRLRRVVLGGRMLPVTRFRVRESFLTEFSRFINSHLHLGSANLSACLIGNQEVGWINRRALVKRLAEPGLDTRIGERWVDAGWANPADMRARLTPGNWHRVPPQAHRPPPGARFVLSRLVSQEDL
jgi:hypothetical protein